jgi:hypothetical protein
VTAGADIVAFVEGLAREGVERFRPSLVAARTQVNVPEAHAVLNKLAQEGMLDAHFELICPNDECHRTIARYEVIEQVPVGDELNCPHCDEPFVPDLNHVWVYYTPSRDLLLKVNRARRPDAAEASPKKALTWIQRLLGRRTTTGSRRAGN